MPHGHMWGGKKRILQATDGLSRFRNWEAQLRVGFDAHFGVGLAKVPPNEGHEGLEICPFQPDPI